jgi:nucleoside-diphosphate-sugar epimerase
MSTVAVTGAAGYLGRLVLQRLEHDPQIGRVVGIDVADPDFTTRNLEFYRMDVRSPHIIQAIESCDAVVHLAAVRGDPDETRDVNVGGTRSVADAATRAGVRKLVFTSTIEVYGAHPDNDFPLTEESAVRPNHQSAYASSKAEAETVVSYYAEAHPGVVVTTLRLAWVCGPTLPTRSASVIDTRVRLAIKGYDPPLQALHEDDAADAIAFAVANDAGGVFNVAPDDVVEQPASVLGQRTVTLEVDRARRLLDRTARLGLSVPAAEISALMYPQVMSGERLRDVGFVPRHSTEEALRAAAEARRDWIAVGKVRFRPKRVALIGGTLGAVLLGGAVNKRRARRAKA